MSALDLRQDQKLEIYRYMKLARAIEERLEILYKQGRPVGAIYLGWGQEAIEVTASYALEEGDVLAVTHRDMAAHLPRGLTARMVFAQHYAKATSPTRGKGEDNYFGDLKRGVFATVSMLPDFYPVIAGAGLAFKMRREPRVGMAYCGDGATNRAEFHEGVNFAAVERCPCVFIIVNNQYAYSTPNEKESLLANLADRASAYGIPGYTVDGNDVLAIWPIIKEAVERARSGEGPTLIEGKTMRMRGHAGHDPMKYVSREKLDEWEARDPIKRFEEHLFNQGIISEKGKNEVDEGIKAKIEDAVKFAEESPYPKGEEAVDDVYAA
ncbi:MAG: thiamine pyrophosphate-dependent dehydrogenase E1 component subunit alpha [Actinobacteria bacterium]|nr:thiamine pyrophosphate-dependent dehydrogenase E1 component subunit alpha [Actinomycetota bacterium]